MGVKFYPGLKQAGIDPSTVDKLKEVQKIPLENAKRRKEVFNREKEELDKLTGLLSGLDAALNGIKSRYDFFKLKLDSSHPDIIDGAVAPGATLGNYEFEVRGMARSEKQLAFGFPDKNESPVGFGFLTIEREDGQEPLEVTVEPGSTLEKVAQQINDTGQGIRAMVINTKFQPDPYRLLVISEKSGKESKLSIDGDTTFLDFKEQVTGRNLDILFEDVPVTDEDNILDDLISDVTLNIRRSEPGTRVQVSVIHDVEATLAGIKGFVDKYNEVSQFINKQYAKDSKTGEYGLLSGDTSLKYVMRQLQTVLSGAPKLGKKVSNLSDIGITTNPKTGTLEMDESKVKSMLSDNYEEVANLFIRHQDGDHPVNGVASAMSEKIAQFRDPTAGALKAKMRGLDKILSNQDVEIARRQRQLEDQEQSLNRRFTALESTLGSLMTQQDFIKAKMGQG